MTVIKGGHRTRLVVVLVSIVIPSGQSIFEKVCNLNETAI